MKYILAFPVALLLAPLAASHAADNRPQVVDEGLYFDVPAHEVAYNVQIVRLDSGGYATVYHGEPKKSAGPAGRRRQGRRPARSFCFHDAVRTPLRHSQ